MDALGVEAVDRLVEHERVRVAEQRRRDPEPLPHAERERPGPLAGDLLQPDQLDHLIHAGARDPVRLRERQQVVDGAERPGWIERASSSAPTRCSGEGRSRYRAPSIVTSPELGASSPTIIRIVVDFPAPFGPRKPVTTPGRTVNESPSTAVFAP